MDDLNQLLLEVWREACQQIAIGESVRRMATALVEHLAVDLLLVRRIDCQRHGLETVACEPSLTDRGPELARSPCSSADLEHLLTWCRRGEVLHESAATLDQRLPGLLPPGISGELLAGALVGNQGPIGVLILAARPPRRFERRDEAIMRQLLEPIGVALENDRRLRELTSLREAAEAENRTLMSRLGRHDISNSIVGSETGLKPVMEQVELVARSDVPVLILGETGSGKEVVARAIHDRSRRHSGPFLRVNCGAIPPELIDSELFGHERGSFTGAVGVRKGWFERADSGTLFLDECGELPLAAQVRLLRILQDGTFHRVGGEKQAQVDVRVVAATHRDLQAMTVDGRFREDLWYRLAVFPIRLPPLRERQEDIPALAVHFALQAAKRLGSPPLVPTSEEMRLLMDYAWPGNVRELAAVIERAAILGDGMGLKVAQALGAGVGPRAPLALVDALRAPLKNLDDFLALDTAMARHIEAALARTQGQIEGTLGAARLLGINPHTLRARMRKLGVDWREFRCEKDENLGEVQRRCA